MLSNDSPAGPPFCLQQLPLAARLTLACFLVTAGVGYFSALVNLHFAEASPGEALPTTQNVLDVYTGQNKVSQLERLLVAHPSQPFNGQGSMRAALISKQTSKYGKAAVTAGNRKEMAEKLGLDVKKAEPADLKRIDEGLQADLDGERVALLAWLRSGEDREKTYEADALPLAGEISLSLHSKVDLAKMNLTPEFVEGEGTERSAKVKSILEKRCVRCHAEGVGGAGGRFPLDTFSAVMSYADAEGPTGKSLEKLALTTHNHLLSFAVLYGFTGLIFALSGWPRPFCVVLAPLPLVAQVIDIAFWWLARLEAPYGPMFATFIPISGGVVALGLGMHIILGTYSLFHRAGKVVVTLLLAGVLVGSYFAATTYLMPYLVWERGNPTESVAK